MQVIFSLFGRLFLLIYIHARRLLPLPLRRWVFRGVKWCIPKKLQAPYSRWQAKIHNLDENDGFRGLSTQFFSHFTEFWFLLRWLWADKERPGIKMAIIPTALRFGATTFQALSFAIIVGYISLATNDWTLAWRDYTFVIEPNLRNTIILAGIIFTTYAGFAILSYISGNLMLRVGLKYQNVLSERVLNQYRDISLEPAQGDYVDSNLLLSIINSECRYLGRALMMLYNIIYQLILAGIGFVALVTLDFYFAILCIAFMVISLIFQIGVMGKTLNDTRNMLRLTGANTLDLRSAITQVSISQTMFSLTRDDINKSLRGKAIRDYNDSYYDRLRVGLFASMVPQLVFALFVAGLFAYSVYAVNKYNIGTALAVQYVFSLRFFLGGLAGVLVGFVAIISFKPFFDNYINMVDTLKKKDADNSSIKSESEHLETTLGLQLTLNNQETLKLQKGQSVSVVINKGAVSWLDISFILNRLLPQPNRSRLNLARDVDIIHTEFPLVNNTFQSMGITSAAAFSQTKQKLAFLGPELDVLESAINKMEQFPEKGAKIWASLKGVHFMLGSLMAALLNEKPILFFSESAFRSISERDRQAVMEMLSNRYVFIHHYALPAYVLKPSPQAFLLLDKDGLIANYSAKEILDLPQDAKDRFVKTSFAPNNALAFLDEDI